MHNDYSKYSSKELLEDDYFIKSIINPTPKSDNFWNSLLEDKIIDPEEFDKACSFIYLMQRPKKMMSAKERNDLWVKIEIKNKKNLRKQLYHKKIYLWGVAASFIILLSVFSFLLIDISKKESTDFYTLMSGLSQTAEETKDIQLILPGQTIELEETSVDIKLDNKGKVLVNSKQLDQATTSKPKEEVSYNQLIVPMGRHSQVTLPDGTKMHVNAGTKVIFPHKFQDKIREIFVDGEVYLEVTPNEKAPFYVHTGKMDIKVLGTVLNVRAYEQDEKQEVVLVSGSVIVKAGKSHETQLVPDQILNYSANNYSISSINAKEYVSWINGYFVYDREPLVNIMKHISRYYGVEITFSSNIPSVTCSGKLDLKEELDKIMNDLSGILPIRITKTGEVYIVNPI